MKIVLIGSGNVATVLGRLIVQKGHSVKQVISQDINRAKELADELQASCADTSAAVDMDSDLVIISISDSNLEFVLSEVRDKRKPVVHTAGGVNKDVLKKYSDNYGVLYPVQTLRKQMTEIPRIPFLVDGSSEEMIEFVENFAKTLSGDVNRANDEERIRLHLAAVIVSNFTNYMYSIAEDYCKKEKVDFNILKPLIMETAQRVMEHSPAEVQTGPAVRKDIQTMDKHLRLLVNYPKLRTTYLRITDSIMNP
ncbi:MAG: F420-dependent NADP oxidoreductase [Ferruginibacter sp.]